MTDPENGPDSPPTRRSPVGRSESGLVSRDWRPRNRGPELVASWPLGHPPGQDEPGGDDWELTDEEYVVVQKNRLTLPYAVGVDFAPSYLNVRGYGRVASGGTLWLRLANNKLDGKPYEVEIELTNATGTEFQSPFVEFTPDRPGEYGPRGEVFAGYQLRAKVEDGTAYLDQGTSVQLWSE